MNKNHPKIKIPQNETEWKIKLGSEKYYVLRQKGTEMPFSGKLLYLKDQGIYTCGACNNPLFSSSSKFDSKSGWPSFDKALPNAIKEVIDKTHNMKRIEIICSNCNSHIGHVFDDGPTETGKRYCANSLSLDFKKKKPQSF